jgi:hypothetical protein
MGQWHGGLLGGAFISQHIHPVPLLCSMCASTPALRRSQSPWMLVERASASPLTRSVRMTANAYTAVYMHRHLPGCSAACA